MRARLLTVALLFLASSANSVSQNVQEQWKNWLEEKYASDPSFQLTEGNKDEILLKYFEWSIEQKSKEDSSKTYSQAYDEAFKENEELRTELVTEQE